MYKIVHLKGSFRLLKSLEMRKMLNFKSSLNLKTYIDHTVIPNNTFEKVQKILK